MSCGEVFPSILISIKDVNDKKVQEARRFVVEENNKSHGHRFVYKLYHMSYSWLLKSR